MTQRTVGPQRVRISETYATTVDDLWDACTNPERIPRWFLPVSGDLRLGGRYQLEGNAGGTIEACDPPDTFTATWEFGGAVSRIRVRLSAEAPDATRLEIDHFDLAEDDHWRQFGPGAVGVGWDLGLHAGLRQHLQTGGAVDPAAAAAWTVSAEGRAFVTESARAWGDAHAAAGAAQDEARAAADRTIAAYTA
jgi:uncharacterized protein YndB with AHSA1/START domain